MLGRRMKEEIKVKIADYKISAPPNQIITLGLGSCVGISIYDSFSGQGGLAHIMLPDSTQFKKVTKEEKFANLAIPKMVQELVAIGVKKRNMIAKIAGGASMFEFTDKSLTMDIGNRNVLAVEYALGQLSIPILAKDVGGNMGRTMILDLEDKKVYIRTMGKTVELS